jgi:hypothetical protein
MSAPLTNAITEVLANVNPKKPGGMFTIATLLDTQGENAQMIQEAQMQTLARGANVSSTALGVALTDDPMASTLPTGPNKPGRGR